MERDCKSDAGSDTGLAARVLLFFRPSLGVNGTSSPLIRFRAFVLGVNAGAWLVTPAAPAPVLVAVRDEFTASNAFSF